MSDQVPTSRKRLLIDIGAIGLASFLLVVPMLLFGIPSGNDQPEHYRFALAFEESINKGTFFPSRSDSVNKGFGDVGVRFYPPMTYWVMNVARLATGNWFYGSILAFFLFFFIGGLGVYLAMVEWVSSSGALVGAIVYLILPYHVNQIYNAFLLAEFAAVALIPFCFLFWARLWRSSDLKDVLYFAVAFALLLLTHIPTSIIVSISLAIYALASMWSSRNFVDVVRAAGGVAFALILSSFYLIRLLAERQWVNHSSPKYASLDYDFRSNFILSYFYVSGSEYLDRSLWFADLMFMITIAASLLLLLLFAKFARSQDRLDARPLAIVFLAAVFFATPLSVLVWSSVPTFAQIQFPFRWMAIISVCAAFFVAIGYGHFFRLRQNNRPLAMIVIGLFLFTASFSLFQIIRPARYSTPAEFANAVERYRTSESCECWWPIWAKRAALTSERTEALNGRTIITESSTATRRTFNVGNGEESQLNIAVFYYPHWRAYVDEAQTDISITDKGTMSINLPAGISKVRLNFEEPQLNNVFRLVSLAGMIVVILLFVLFRRRMNANTE